MSKQKTVHKILLVMMMSMLVTVHFTSFVVAAPPALPPCGHDALIGSSDSGTVDIDSSADGYYTAVAWTEGSDGTGNLKLAYSTIFTSTSAWISQPSSGNVDTGSYEVATIDFDPVATDTVHIAYRDSSGIRYANCVLGGSCSTPYKVTGTDGNSRNPQIAATPDGVVIVFDDNSDSKIKYVHILGGVSGNVSNVFEPYSGIKGKNPSIVYNNGKVHVVFNNDSDGTPDATDDIQYFNLKATDMISGTSTALDITPASSTPGLIGGQSGGGSLDADDPSIAAVGNTAMVVWDYKHNTDPGGLNDYYILAGSILTDTSTTNWTNARIIPTNGTVLGGPDGSKDDKWESRAVGGETEIFDRLHPDVSLVEHSGSVYAHVVWQAEISSSMFNSGYGNRPSKVFDILYAYADLDLPDVSSVTWQGIPMGNDGTFDDTFGAFATNPNGRTATDPSITDLTVEYFVVGQQGNAQPRAVFLGNSNPYDAKHGYNRLQLVYRSQVGSGKFDVRYNGFEMGKDNLLTPPFDPDNVDMTMQNSDCDVYYSDAQEIQIPDVETCSLTIGTGNDYKEFNCDVNFSTGDEIPDYLDTNSDGDFQSDLAEGRKDEINGVEDVSWRVPDTDGGVFLPVVLKN